MGDTLVVATHGEHHRQVAGMHLGLYHSQEVGVNKAHTGLRRHHMVRLELLQLPRGLVRLPVLPVHPLKLDSRLAAIPDHRHILAASRQARKP